MKMILLLCVLLVPIAAWAGTFKDYFNDDNLANWDKLIQGGSVKIKDGLVIITDSGYSRTTGITFNNGQEIGDF